MAIYVILFQKIGIFSFELQSLSIAMFVTRFTNQNATASAFKRYAPCMKQ